MLVIIAGIALAIYAFMKKTETAGSFILKYLGAWVVAALVFAILPLFLGIYLNYATWGFLAAGLIMCYIK